MSQSLSAPSARPVRPARPELCVRCDKRAQAKNEQTCVVCCDRSFIRALTQGWYRATRLGYGDQLVTVS